MSVSPAPGKSSGEGDGLPALEPGHPGGGLVEHQASGAGREGDGDSSCFLIPVHRTEAEESHFLRQPHLTEEGQRFLADAPEGSRHREGVAAHPVMGKQGHLDVLEDRHPREDVGDLEGAADPFPDDPVRGQLGDRFPLEHDAARVGPDQPRHDVEKRRLARTVRPDDGADLALRHGEGDVLERPKASERLYDLSDFEKDHLRMHPSFPRV